MPELDALRSQRHAPNWPWVVLAVTVLGVVLTDAATVWQHDIAMPFPYAYALETSVSELAYGVVGAILCTKVRGNLLGPIMLGVAILGAIQGLSGVAAVTGVYYGWPSTVTELAGGVFGASQARSVGLVALLLMLAPTGQPLSRAWSWLIRGYVVLLILGAAATLFVGPDPASLDGYPQGQGLGLPVGQSVAEAVVAVTSVAIMVGVLLGCICLAMRWLRSTGLDRQRVTWVVLGGLAGPVVVLADVMVTRVITGSSQTTELHGSIVWAIAGAMLPLGIAVAVLRHGLYDIDRVVSRTVSYTLLTGCLVAIYALTVTTVTHVLPVHSKVPVATATLFTAAAFQPLLRRVRRSVDRRFDRASYNATATVAAFALTLDRQVELPAIESSLRRAVQETVNPNSVTVWLAP